MRWGGSLPRDGIVRISSITKLIAAATTLSLVDACALSLDDPVDRWVPTWADRRVRTTADAVLTETVPAHRATTVRDLLQMGFGIGYAGDMADNPIMRAAQEAGLLSHWLPPQMPPHIWAEQISQLPMAHQPGAGWLYQTSFDALTVVVEAVCAQTFDEVVSERILRPLGMRDTGYWLVPSQCERVAPLRFPDGNGDVYEVSPAGDRSLLTRPSFCSAATGLVSTVTDLVLLACMLLDRGQGPNGQVLSAPMVQTMATDTTGGRFAAMIAGFLTTGAGWGLGAGTDHGWFGWDGGTGASVWLNPERAIAGVLLTTRGMGEGRPEVFETFWNLVRKVD